MTGSSRSYAASGVGPGDSIVSTYNAGPFVAGAALAALERIGVCHIPVGTGNTERLMLAIEQLEATAVALTPSYAAYLIEWAAARGLDLRGSSVVRLLVAGEPGGGEPAFRARLEEGWGARVTEAMGIGDIGPSLWGECEEQDGMHLGARGFVHAELVDPESGAARALPTALPASSCSRTSGIRQLRSSASARETMSTSGRRRARADEPAHGCDASGGRTTCSSSAASTCSRRPCVRSSALSRHS